MQKELTHRSERQKQMPNKHKTEVGHFSSDQLNANKNKLLWFLRDVSLTKKYLKLKNIHLIN